MKNINIVFTILFFYIQNIISQKTQVSDTIDLNQVTVEAINIPSKNSKYLYPITDLNFKKYQLLTPQINIGEYLESVPGLFIMNNNNYAQDSRISIRGFGSRANFGIRGIKVFVDGIPETSPDGQSQIDNINLEIIEGIKVYRGNNSSFFGSSSAGVISITTLEDFSKDFINIGHSFGSYNTNKTQATIGLTRINEKMIFFVSNTKSSGYRNHSGFENFNMNFKFIKKINSYNKLQLVANFLNSPDAQDSGGLNIDEVESDRSQARNRNIQYDSREKVKQYKLGLNLTSRFNNFKLINSIYFNQRLFDGKLPFNYGGIVDLKRAFWGYNFNINIDGSINYNLGFTFNNQNDDRQRFRNDFGIKSEQTMGQNEKYSNIGLSFFGSKNLGRFDFSLGLRFDKNTISVDNYFRVASEKKININSLNPSFNILYGLDNIDLFANFSSGYETPTLNELSATLNESGFNDDLRTIKSKTFEFGFSNNKLKSKLSYNIRAFNISTLNEITPYESNSGQTLYRNAGKTIKKGLEFEIISKITDYINFDYSLTIGSYKFQSFKLNDDDYSNKRIPGIPNNNHSFKIKYLNKKDLNIILGWKNIGELYADNSNNTLINSFNLISMKISKKMKLFNMNILPFIAIDNLLNEKYYDNIRINAFGSRFYEPAPKINFIGGIKLNI